MGHQHTAVAFSGDLNGLWNIYKDSSGDAVFRVACNNTPMDE